MSLLPPLHEPRTIGDLLGTMCPYMVAKENRGHCLF